MIQNLIYSQLLFSCFLLQLSPFLLSSLLLMENSVKIIRVENIFPSELHGKWLQTLITYHIRGHLHGLC
jgi:hypothetical protein